VSRFFVDYFIRSKRLFSLSAIIELRNSGLGKPTWAHDIELPPDVPLFAPGLNVAVPSRTITGRRPPTPSAPRSSGTASDMQS
jgi:hypothetical protein